MQLDKNIELPQCWWKLIITSNFHTGTMIYSSQYTLIIVISRYIFILPKCSSVKHKIKCSRKLMVSHRIMQKRSIFKASCGNVIRLVLRCSFPVINFHAPHTSFLSRKSLSFLFSWDKVQWLHKSVYTNIPFSSSQNSLIWFVFVCYNTFCLLYSFFIIF